MYTEYIGVCVCCGCVGEERVCVYMCIYSEMDMFDISKGWKQLAGPSAVCGVEGGGGLEG